MLLQFALCYFTLKQLILIFSILFVHLITISIITSIIKNLRDSHTILYESINPDEDRMLKLILTGKYLALNHNILFSKNIYGTPHFKLEKSLLWTLKLIEMILLVLLLNTYFNFF